jgi:DNA polymerase-3 subunit epsilon
MKLNLKNPIIFFDLETTGINIAADRIVEISYLKVDLNGNESSKTLRVNPGIPIPPETTAIHGISDEDVKDAPGFNEVGKSIARDFEGCDLAGYNSNRFDIPLLAEEFLRVGIDIDLKRRKFVDVQVIFMKMEQRTLAAASKFFLGKELIDAHSAEADTRATYEVLQAQLECYSNLENDIGMLADFSTHNRNVDFAGRIVLNDDDVEVFNFGKHKGKPVTEILAKDPGYYGWMINGDFPLYTKKVLTNIKLNSKK